MNSLATVDGVVFHLQGWLLVGVLVNTVLPLLVALVTKTWTDSRVQAILLALLAAITGLGSEAIAAHNAGTDFDLGIGLLTALTGFLVAVGMHFGLWKPTRLTASLLAVGSHRGGPHGV